jgi:hydrophobe/amphiphile efflux-3 (HAE3) family protein
MTVRKRFEQFASGAARRPVLTISIVVALALAGGLLSLGLKPSAGTDTFVGKSSASYQATVSAQRHFGGDPVIVLIHEPLPDLVETKDLAKLTELEACFAGQYVVADASLRAFVPAGGYHIPYGGLNSPCGKLARYRPAQVVYGPGTFLNRAVAAVNTQIQSMLSGVSTSVKSAEAAAYQLAIGQHLSKAKALSSAKAAGALEQQQQYQSLEQLALSTGITALPSIDSPQFIPEIVFDQTRGVNQPKARFAYLFPTANSALIQIRLRASLSDAQQAQAINWIRQAIRMPMFQSAYGGRYTVTGVPVVLHDLSSQISGSIAGLLVAALLVMAATLLVVFRSRLRLLPLAVALAATGITFGLLAILGATLTMASIAVLPILIGLAVDYGIQFQARAEEARQPDDSAAAQPDDSGAAHQSEAGSRAGGRPEGEPGWRAGGMAEAAKSGGAVSARRAVAEAAGGAAPTIATAALATATGFLVLLLSPVPMVQGFGLVLVLGIAVALVCALTAGSAALVLAERDLGALGASLRGAAELLGGAGRRGGGAAGRPLQLAGRAVGTALRGAAEILAGVGRRVAGAGGRRSRRSPLRPAPGSPRAGSSEPWAGRLVGAVLRQPGRVIAVAAVLALLGWVADTQTGVQSDVTKLVPAGMPALRNLRTLEKVTGVSGEIDVTVNGANVASPATVGWMIRYENQLLEHYGYVEEKGCAYSTLCPALSLPDLFSTSSQAANQTPQLSQAQINSLLAAVPQYFSQAVITHDHRHATLAFGIRLMPLARQERVIEYMQAHLHPPAGVNAQLTGLPVLAAQANDALSSASRRLLTLVAGLLAVGLVLTLVFRGLRRAVVPMIPIALATGWSALILFLIGIPLNPMSATLGTLVIAISTEFSVLLSERFRQERAAGHDLATALGRTYRSTGAAVIASGVTAIFGFGVLIFSNITMLRDFGFVTLVDLTVSLGGVLLVLPAVIALSERDDVPARIRSAAASAGLQVRRRRRPRVA